MDNHRPEMLTLCTLVPVWSCTCTPLSLVKPTTICTTLLLETTTTGFGGAFWRNSIIALALSFAAYRVSIAYTPAAQGADLDAEHGPNETLSEADDKSMPFLTRYIAHHMPREGIWKERNAKHLELTVKQAEDQLLIQEAQKPVIRRLRYPGMFEQASPHCKLAHTI